jgi:Prokaryotic dksA/traR C4-type zinc finger
MSSWEYSRLTKEKPPVNPSQDRAATDLDTLLRKRFRDLAGEYELLVHGGAGLYAGDDADDMRCELDDLADAINRIDDGLYGACRQCGQGIAMARLSAMPTVTLCGDCAE